jgi:organic radical activating enzyme
MESFYTIKGAGYHSGQEAYFISLGGCDVDCVWCALKYPWPMDGFPMRTAQELADETRAHTSDMAVITGGEPLIYNLDELTAVLKENNIRTHLETSGAYELSGQWDWLCLSPKKFKKPILSICSKADELKVIVFNKSDFRWAEEYAELVGPKCKLFLQPEYSREKEMLPEIINYVKTHPRWKISLQIHKIMDIP